MKQKESTLHSQVCSYLKIQYPKVLFMTDLSGIKLTIGQAVKLKYLRSGRAWPDLFIAEPRGRFSGMFIELKADTPYRQGGMIKKNQHLEEQEKMLIELINRGYYCFFGYTFDGIKKTIDDYMRNVPVNQE